MELLDELNARGLLASCTDLVDLRHLLESGGVTLYCGFDPTADSLHVGHLMGQVTLRRFQIAGHRPIALAGGATGSIGDPSGKTSERQLLNKAQLAHNLDRIRSQLRRILDFECSVNPARLVDNATWTEGVSFIDFLRDIGKHFSVNAMVAKESVRARMEDRATGISYTEFSYMLLQANDFLHLYETMNCALQIGGSDQWGNITAGIDLIRKKAAQKAFGLTFPLLARPDGTKFGKTETGTIWLDPGRTSPYRFYQFFVQTDDDVVGSYLRMLTLLPLEEIDEIERRHRANPEEREAQRVLATAMTGLVHGASAAADAAKASKVLFGGGIEGVQEQIFEEIASDIPSSEVPRSLLEAGTALVDLLHLSALCPSKGRSRQDIEAGAIYVNNTRSGDPRRVITTSELIFGRYLLLRRGKRTYALIIVR